MSDKLQKLEDELDDKPEVKVTDEDADAAIKSLNLAEKFSVERRKAEEVFGKYHAQQGIAAPLLTTTFHSIRSLEECQQFAMSEAKKDGLEPKDRAALLNVLVIATKALPELVKKAQELESKLKKTVKPASGRNAPPMFPSAGQQIVVQGDNIHIHEANPKPTTPQDTATTALEKPQT